MFSVLSHNLLRNYVRVRTHDLDEATAATTGASVPHQTELVAPREKFDYCASLVRLKSTALGFVTARGRLNINAGPSSSAVMIRLGLAGACEHRLAGETVLLSQDWAVVQSPEDLAKIKTSESFQTLALTIKASAITGELENRLAHSAGAGIRFAPEMNMRTVLGQRFRQQAIRLSLELDKNSANRRERSLALQEMERSLFRF